MANSTMKIDLIFQANTQAALNNIQSLSNMLNKISTKTVIGVDGGSLQTAVKSAEQLQTALAQATNVDTGKIDLNKLNSSLKQSGTNLQQLARNLQNTGTQGQQSFVKLANAIAQAETPMFKLNAKLKEFGVSLINTVKWQIASNMIHGVQSAIDGAISHAKDLNGALNDIRIVTGKSIDEMSKFADVASKAAKELNTTTTEYSKAALIFYQQGLEGNAVTERAETVLKLAQVTGESAEKISDQMTAVWNNFYDGSKSLEYYADVLTKLGADTASSSDEIIQGLEKFAATADTIGLSYEYAAASLATVVAETRQAPEVVGNAFKTLFARLQGLSLGETLEDGTDLTKYSKALQAVGVQIKDQFGELKNADTILTETAEAWDSLGKSEQVALAQTVGGMRQYSQFIALMENWDKVEMNVDVAKMSEGELTTQQEIWSESWEAADKRVQQSKNELYENILNDETMIKFTDMWSNVIDGVGKFIDNIGGILPLAGTLIAVFSKQLFPLLQTGFTQLKNNLAVLTGSAAKQVAAMQNQVRAEIDSMIANGKLSEATANQLKVSDKLIAAKQELARATKNMSIAEKEAAERKMAIIEMTANEIQKSLELQVQLENEIKTLKEKASAEMSTSDFQKNKEKDAYQLFNRFTRGEGEEEPLFHSTQLPKSVTADHGKEIVNLSQKTHMGITKQTLSDLEQGNVESVISQLEKRKKSLSDQGDTDAVKKLQDRIKNLQSEDAETRQDALDKEINKYKVILKIQEDQLNITKETYAFRQKQSEIKDNDDLKNKTFFNNAEMLITPGDESSQNQMLESLKKQTMTELGGQEKDKGEGFQLEGSIPNLEKAIKLQAQYRASQKKAKAVQTDLVNASKKYRDSLQEMSKSEKLSIQQKNKLEQETKESIQTFKNSETAIVNLAKNLGMADGKIEGLENAFKNLDLGGEQAAQSMNFIEATVEELGFVFETSEQPMKDVVQTIKDLLKAAGMAPEQVDELATKLTKLADTAERTGQEMDEFNKKSVSPQSPKFSQTLTTIATNAMQVVGAIQSAVSAVQSLGQAFDADATPMENFTNYLMGVMGLLPVLTTMMQVFSAVRKKDTDDTIKDNAKKDVSNLKTGAIGAFKGAIESFGVWGVVIGGVLAAAILAGGILALTVSAPKAKEEQEEENMAGTLSSLKSSLSEATEAAKEFKESVSNYEDGIKGLEELKKGTEEYEKKLEEVNAQAKELISTYGLWDDYKIENGVYKINEEKLDEIEAQKDASVRNLEKTVVAADIGYDIAKYKSSIAQTAADSYWDNAWSGVGGLVVDNVLLPGSGLGSVAAGAVSSYRGSSLTAEEIDTVVKAMNDSGRVFDPNTMTGDTFIEELSKIDGLASIIEDNKWALKTYREEIIASAKIQSDYTNSMQQKTEALLALDIEDKYGELIKSSFGSDIDEGTMDAVSKIMAESSEDRTNASEVLKQALEDANVGSLSEADRNSLAIAKEQYGGNMDYEELTKEYAKLKGLSPDEIEDLVFEDKDWKGTLKTASGETKIDQIYYDEMVRALKEAELTNQITGQLDGADQAEREAQAQALGEMTTTFNNTIDGLGDAILNSMTTGKTDNGNYSLDLTSVFDDLSSQAEVDALTGLNEQDLIAKLGLTPEKIEQMGFDSAEAFENAFDKGLEDWSIYAHEEQVQAEVDSILQTAASEYELDEEVLQTQAKLLQENVKGLEDNAKAAAEMAILNQRMNKGVDTLTESWEDWKDTLKSSDKTSQDYAEALVEVSKAMKDILGLSKDSIIPEDFLASDENLDLLDQVAEGSEEAVDELGYNLLKAQIEAQEITQDIHNNIAGILDVENLSAEDALEQFNILKTGLLNSVDEMQASLDGLNPGTAFEGEKAIQFAEALNAYAAATKMTSEQMHEYLSEAGVDAEVKTSVIDTTMKVPETTTEETVVPTGLFTKKIISKVTDTKLVDAPGQVEVAQINMDGSGKGPKITKIERGNITPSVTSTAKNSGGGGSAPSKVDKTKKSEVVNRYEEINNALDDVNDRADRAASAMDRLYGTDKLKAMRDQKKALQEEVKLLEEKQKWNEKYLKEDKAALEKTASEMGIKLQFDENGNVLNYTDALSLVYDELEKREKHMDGLSTGDEQDAYEEQYVTPLRDWISEFSDNYDTYKDTNEEKEDFKIEIEDLKYEEQDLTAEEFSYKIELRTEIEESELDKLDYYLNKFSNDFYKTAESAALTGDKIKISQSSLHNIGNDIKELDALLANGSISQNFYIESLQKSKEEIYAQLETLQELDETMMNYYGDTLSMAQEELTKYTDRMDHSTSVLDHYRSLLDLTGQSQNFKAIGTVLEGQAKTIENSYQIAKENYEWLADEAVKKKQAMNDALARGDAEAAELYENEWKTAEEKMRESQDKMLSMAEEWAGKLKEVLENKLTEIADVLENALTGGRSFDELSMQMEHAQGIQEEYLTTTNKIYATNKMIRNAQNEIDKTTNTVAKQKLKAFQQETQQLQNQGQLSQFELDIQQKKYDLLLAQIALEEAQNAKSTVQLQRDSEGNFGYIYTADQNEVSNAQQNMEDAENALYNARLEGANNYVTQRQELLSGLYDALADLDNRYYIEGIVSEEEYNRQKEAIQNYYFKRLGQNSELYAIATNEDANVVQDAWSSAFDIMDTDANDLVIAVKEYLNQSQEAFREYQIGIEEIANETGVSLENLSSNVQNVTDENDKLKDKIIDEVIPALQGEMDEVERVTDEYALHREEILKVIGQYENLVKYIDQTVVESVGNVADEFDNIETQAKEAMTAIDLLAEKLSSIDTSGISNIVDATSGFEQEEDGNEDKNSYENVPFKEKQIDTRYHQDKTETAKFKIGDTGKNIYGTHNATKNDYIMYPYYEFNPETGNMDLKSNVSVYEAEGNNNWAYTYGAMSLHADQQSGYMIADRKNVNGIWYYKISSDGKLDKASNWIKETDLQTLDTGGYTGEWGPEGKLALLHQKELVLNASQTEDLLMTMELLDSIIKQIDMMTMNNKINQMSAAMNQAISAMYREQVAQEVHIEANFPNATDRNEIYQALEMLANDASQFINR